MNKKMGVQEVHVEGGGKGSLGTASKSHAVI